MLIHQIYIDWGAKKPSIFYISRNSWENLGKYKLWNEEDFKPLLVKYPLIKQLYDKCIYPVMKVDLMRWAILYEYGGLYCDCDVVNKSGNLDFIGDRKSFITKIKNRYEIDIIYFKSSKNSFFDNLFDFLNSSFEYFNSNPIYKIRVGRFILYTYGQIAINRYIKKNKINISTIDFHIQNTNEIGYGWNNIIIKNIENSPVIIYKSHTWIGKENNCKKRYRKKPSICED